MAVARPWGAAALGLVLVWSYRTTPRGMGPEHLPSPEVHRSRLALSLCLLEPLWSGQRARPGTNLMAVVADNSQGLQIRDVEGLLQPREGLRDLLDAGKSSWIPALAESFEIRQYQFDSRLQAVPDFSATFDGRSAMVGALRSVGSGTGAVPRRVLLFTDGNATDLAGLYPDLKGCHPFIP